MIANGLNGSAPLNRVREFQRFSHNDSLKARMILISQGVTWSAIFATGFTFLCVSALSATASAAFLRRNLSYVASGHADMYWKYAHQYAWSN